VPFYQGQGAFAYGAEADHDDGTCDGGVNRIICHFGGEFLSLPVFKRKDFLWAGE
jgi:hypothetical protein